jgi:aminomethyltransferase
MVVAAGRVPLNKLDSRALPTPVDTLRRTPLYERHRDAGARLVPFAGWEMPVEYEGIRIEHLAVRTGAGIFDVSHMGQVETSGPDAERFLQHALSNDIAKIPPAGAQYSVLCREGGGIVDDLFTYRLEDRFLTVTNASRHGADTERLRELAEGYDVTLHDAAEEYAMLALQGPNARAELSRLIGGEAPARMRVTLAEVAGAPCLVCGTGYTGEDGVELLTRPEYAPKIWDALTAEAVVPVGLGARDTLRLEVCFHLYGNDMSEERNPIEAGLGWACKLETGFVGSDALREVDPPERLAAFAFTSPGIPRPGNPVRTEDGMTGVVTSGTLSPSLGTGIGLAYVPRETAASPGARIEVDVRGKLRQAEIREKPLYRREN